MSRFLGVYAQDHKSDSDEACVAIYRLVSKIGGRPEELVIDQDSVFAGKEVYGEVFETETSEAFLEEQQLGLWCRDKHDPQSKGAVENSVKYVKTSFFSARSLADIAEVRQALPGWVERSNKRTRQTTYRVPATVFETEERPALRPLLPSVHEVAPTNLIKVSVGSQPLVQYKACKYSVPWDFCLEEAYYKTIGDKPRIYDCDRKHGRAHQINPVRGSSDRLEEHRREEASDWTGVAERLRERWNCPESRHLTDGLEKENPRHLAQQLLAVESLPDDDMPDRGLVTEVISECCRDFRYRFTQSEAACDLRKAERAKRGEATGDADEAPATAGVQARSLEQYRKAYQERIVS